MNSPTKSMFFFGQPGCLKNSPVKSSPSMSPQFGGGESSALNFSEKYSESLAEDSMKTDEKQATESDNDREPKTEDLNVVDNEKSLGEKSIPDESHTINLATVPQPVKQPLQSTSEPIQEIPKSELKPTVSEQSVSETAKDTNLEEKTNGDQPPTTINSANEPNTSQIAPCASENHASKNPVDDKLVEEVSSEVKGNESIKTDGK
jgi:hypothetical protein